MQKIEQINDFFSGFLLRVFCYMADQNERFHTHFDTFLFCQFCILAKCRTILNFKAYNPKVSENVSFNTRIINYYDFMLKMKKFKIGQNTNCRAVVLFYPGIRSQKLSGLEAGQGRIRLF